MKNILGILAGVILGAVINGSLITISGHIIPPPDGTDLTTEEGLKAAIPLMEAKHFLFPFLAHALGTLVGAYVAALIATSKKVSAIVVGFFFLAGGIWSCFLIPAPAWFMIADIVLAYIPMALLGWKAATRQRH